jgi:hypothetical protein
MRMWLPVGASQPVILVGVSLSEVVGVVAALLLNFSVIRVILMFFWCNWIVFLGFRVVIVVKVVRIFTGTRIIGVIRVIAGVMVVYVTLLYGNWRF